jgi:hypothetical protein
MPIPPLLAIYIGCAGLTLIVVALILHQRNRFDPTQRLPDVLTFFAVAVMLALAPLAFFQSPFGVLPLIKGSVSQPSIRPESVQAPVQEKTQEKGLTKRQKQKRRNPTKQQSQQSARQTRQ